MATTTTTIIERDDTREAPTAEAPVADPGASNPDASGAGNSDLRTDGLREDRRTRVALAREAGWRRISFASVSAGVFVAYGAFALLLGVVSAVLDAIGVDTDGLSNADWRGIGIGSAAALFVVLLVTYFYGGYVAGRMARRSGVLNGLLVAVVGVGLLAIGAGIVIGLDAGDAIRDRLQDLGAPTSEDQWLDIGSAAGIAGLLAMLVGSALGGLRGERWHDRLVERAADPAYGPRADATGTRDVETVAAEQSDADEPEPVVWSQAPTPAPAPPERAAAEPVADEPDAAGAHHGERDAVTPSGP